jgi:hypothetical protein
MLDNATAADAVPAEAPLWTGQHATYILPMVAFRADTCDKCKNANPVSYRSSPKRLGRRWC